MNDSVFVIVVGSFWIVLYSNMYISLVLMMFSMIRLVYCLIVVGKVLKCVNGVSSRMLRLICSSVSRCGGVFFRCFVMIDEIVYRNVVLSDSVIFFRYLLGIVSMVGFMCIMNISFVNVSMSYVIVDVVICLWNMMVLSVMSMNGWVL